VDPQRLFLRSAIPFDYYRHDPWLGFHPAASHLWQRPREIHEIWTTTERAPEFSTGPVPTYATTLRSGMPEVAASTVGLLAPGPGLPPLSATAALPLRAQVHGRAHAEAAVRHYHVFSSFRPWWISQQYLPAAERPVDLAWTMALLCCLGVSGLGLMIAFGRHGRQPPEGTSVTSRGPDRLARGSDLYLRRPQQCA
jgi:hypothetical protein